VCGFCSGARFLGGQLFVSLITGINSQSNVSSGRIIAAENSKKKTTTSRRKRLHISGPGLRPGDVQKISLIIFYP
jgi:hypothetical protein